MINIFKSLAKEDHEQLVFCNDDHTGLKAIIAIHDTKLGPALGGCRMYPYAKEEDALFDVLRLSKGMTYKAAVAGLNLGGGKSVIICDPKDANETMMRTFGRFVERLNGRYITAEDVGTSVELMDWVKQETKYVTGIDSCFGGSGDPSPFTAHGTFVGIKAALKKTKGTDSLSGIKILVQGIGNVGYYLCKELHEAGAKLFVQDINPKATERAARDFKATIVDEKNMYSLDVDVYSPCALGATLNDNTISLLKCYIVAGAANNQLLDETKHAEALKNKGILYAPDYVINAGGLINVDTEVHGGGSERSKVKTEKIYDTLLKIFDLAVEKKITTKKAADMIAEMRLKSISRIKEIY